MTAAVLIDVDTFKRRLDRLHSLWQSEKGDGSMSGADVLLVALGEPSETTVYQKSTAFFMWLLGYEFPETVLAIRKDGAVLVLTSVRKAAILKQLSDGHGAEKVQLFSREKERSKATPVMEAFWQACGGEQVKVAMCGKDRNEGPMLDEWQAFFEGSYKEAKAEAAPFLSRLFSGKEEGEVEAASLAARTSSVLMEEYVARKVLSVVDEGKKVSHADLSETIENHVADQLGRYKAKLPAGLLAEQVDLCYPPIIQSGGVFSLKASAVSNEEPVHGGGAILCSLGLRYKSYCSNTSRTLLVNPSSEQEEALGILQELQKHLIGFMKPGAALSEVYAAGIQFVSRLKPGMEKHLPPSFGFAMGLEFREPDWVIGPKCTQTVLEKQVYNLTIGFQGLTNSAAKDPRERSYALLLADTLLVEASGTRMLTSGLSALKDVSYSLKKASAAVRELPAASSRNRVRRNAPDPEAEKRRKEHQKELLLASTKAALARCSAAPSKESAESKEEAAPAPESYRKESAMPRDLCTDWKVVVDKRHETIVLPIQGFAVPFHISTIKNVTKGEEGDWTSLRINFNTPTGRTNNPSQMPQFSEWIRGVVFRSVDGARVQETLRSIQELRKTIADREAARKEMSGLVAQAELSEISGGGRRPVKLTDVYMRPTMEARRAPGDVEIHNNGIRFRAQITKGGAQSHLDILFSNIARFFFQPCDQESLVILHVHLRDPIMVGKRKTRDIQFYREAIDSLVDETSGRRTRMRFGDEDELAQEAEERRRRTQANAEFKGFAERLVEQAGRGLDVDVPFRDLSFTGIYTKHSVQLQPTTDCLVQLSEPPFLVVPLADVEIAYLERIIFGLKAFDLVLVLKDHSKPVVSINSIPVGALQGVKDWLDSVDLAYAESKINFNWPNILKTIQEDPVDFYENGGWASLQPDEDGSEGSGSDGSDEDMSSAYEPDDDEEEFEEESESAEEEEEEESEFSDEDDSEASEDDDDDDEESAPDWDELERRAAREDARREPGASKKVAAPPAKKARR